MCRVEADCSTRWDTASVHSKLIHLISLCAVKRWTWRDTEAYLFWAGTARTLDEVGSDILVRQTPILNLVLPVGRQPGAHHLGRKKVKGPNIHPLYRGICPASRTLLSACVPLESLPLAAVALSLQLGPGLVLRIGAPLYKYVRGDRKRLWCIPFQRSAPGT